MSFREQMITIGKLLYSVGHEFRIELIHPN